MSPPRRSLPSSCFGFGFGGTGVAGGAAGICVAPSSARSRMSLISSESSSGARPGRRGSLRLGMKYARGQVGTCFAIEIEIAIEIEFEKARDPLPASHRVVVDFDRDFDFDARSASTLRVHPAHPRR